jgi:hypothetical protein
MDITMNERIRELAEEAGISLSQKDYSYYWVESAEDIEKFAELIVRECINKVRSRQMFGIEDEHNIHHAFDLLVYDLESYFGVEE